MNGLMTGQILTPKPSLPELEAQAVCLDPASQKFEVRWPWKEERVVVEGEKSLLATLRPDLAGAGRPLHWWKVFGPPKRTQWLGSPLLPPKQVVDRPRKGLSKAQRLAQKQVELHQGTGDLGIDLVNRADEVLKLYMAGFGRKLLRSGLSETEVEDLLQEVYKGLLVRNAGKCPWDPKKGTFGTYVHRVCSGQVSNYLRKRNRIRSVEQIGVLDSSSDEGVVDVGDCRTLEAEETSAMRRAKEERAMRSLAEQVRRQGVGEEVILAVKMIPLVYQGMNYKEIASELGVRKSDVSKANKVLQAGAIQWKALKAANQ